MKLEGVGYLAIAIVMGKALASAISNDLPTNSTSSPSSYPTSPFHLTQLPSSPSSNHLQIPPALRGMRFRFRLPSLIRTPARQGVCFCARDIACLRKMRSLIIFGDCVFDGVEGTLLMGMGCTVTWCFLIQLDWSEDSRNLLISRLLGPKNY